MSLLSAAEARITGPAIGYLLIALLVTGACLVGSVALNLYQWRGAAVVATKATDRIDVAVDANAGAMATIALYKAELASCQAGHTRDQAAAVAVLTEHSQQFERLTRDAVAARAALATSLAGRCRDWGDQPACGVTP